MLKIDLDHIETKRITPKRKKNAVFCLRFRVSEASFATFVIKSNKPQIFVMWRDSRTGGCISHFWGVTSHSGVSKEREQ
ncbi:hypothetical protein CEXT_537891 [Caerostris extrusa]|uniref:Uncharacterized protein n=1 Tax=Caerostris extrusa TaxID=172846 RepID=A0AAV4XJ96_CAEEX|nr:hypothetical protein CEXT_537891 [Caerostris extrusa]